MTTTTTGLRVLACAALALLAACASPAGVRRDAGCDRACLKGQIDHYLAAMTAHDPRRLRLDPKVRFTEDTAQMPLGQGLWQTATALRGFRQDYLDVRAGVAASHVVVEAGGKPVMLALRLKVEHGRLREIETMTVHDAHEGMFFEVDSLKAASPEMAKVPPDGQRETRESLIRIATGYPAGLKIGSFLKADTQLAADAYRFENGRRMAGPGCSFQPPSCENMKAQRIPTLSGITYRVVAVDEELGLVLLRLDFGPGSLFGPDDRWLHAWEAFKVYGGQIHAAEAFMRGMPAHTPSGW
jgi:hypothetical protein